MKLVKILGEGADGKVFLGKKIDNPNVFYAVKFERETSRAKLKSEYERYVMLDGAGHFYIPFLYLTR